LRSFSPQKDVKSHEGYIETQLSWYRSSPKDCVYFETLIDKQNESKFLSDAVIDKSNLFSNRMMQNKFLAKAIASGYLSLTKALITAGILRNSNPGEKIITHCEKFNCPAYSYKLTGCQPLDLALHHQHGEIARYLLSQGFYSSLIAAEETIHTHLQNMFDARRDSPPLSQEILDGFLLHAVKSGHTKIVKLLLERQSEADIFSDYDGDTDSYLTHVHVAIKTGNLEIFELLIRDPKIISALRHYQQKISRLTQEEKKTQRQQIPPTLLQFAAYHNQLEMFKRLMALNKPDIVGDMIDAVSNHQFQGKSHPYCVMKNPRNIENHQDFIAYFLEKGMGINEKTEGMTLLHYAVKNKVEDMVVFLLKQPGINVDVICDHSGGTALHLAVRSNNLAIVERLLVAGSNPNIIGYSGTPLEVAVHHGNITMVERLLAAGGNPNIRYAWGSPLYYAARVGNLTLVERLIDAGANIHAMHRFTHKTAIAIAYESGRHDVVRLLQRYGAVLPEHYQEQGATNALVNNSQSTHTASVHADVATSIKKLKNRYKGNINIADVLQDIESWFVAYEKQAKVEETRSQEKQYEDQLARRAFDRLKKSGFREARTEIGIQEALAYVWCAMHDQEQVNSRLTELTEKDTFAAAIAHRRNLFLNHLYQAENEYNLDADGKVQHGASASGVGCLAGNFNKVVETLNGGLDDDVNIRVINKEVAGCRAQALISEQLLAHENVQERKKWVKAFAAYPQDEAVIKKMIAALQEKVFNALCEKSEGFTDFLSEEVLQEVCRLIVLEYAHPSEEVMKQCAQEITSSTSSSSEAMLFFQSKQEEKQEEEEEGKAESTTTKFTLDPAVVEKHKRLQSDARRRHISQCSKAYAEHLSLSTNADRFPPLTLPIINTHSDDDFQDKFEGQNIGVDFEAHVVLKKALTSRYQAYAQHFPSVFRHCAYYSAEIKKTLSELQTTIEGKMKILERALTAIDEYAANSHRNYGERFHDYLAIQRQFHEIQKFEEQLGQLLPCFFQALHEQNAQTLRKINATFNNQHVSCPLSVPPEKETLTQPTETKKPLSSVLPTLPMSQEWQEGEKRRHIKIRRQIYHRHLALTANPEKIASMCLPVVENGGGVSFDGIGHAKNIINFERLKKALDEKITVYEKHLPQVLAIHPGYTMALQIQLKDLLEKLHIGINMHLKTPILAAINQYKSKSSTRERSECYSAIQLTLQKAREFDEQLHQHLPAILNALEQQRDDALKEICRVFCCEQMLEVVPHSSNIRLG
jgi:ankyrin repeat protein